MYGMTLRDWFAGQALAGLHWRNPNIRFDDQYARLAHEYANNMIAEREKADLIHQ